jgi:hypothetical protein
MRTFSNPIAIHSQGHSNQGMPTPPPHHHTLPWTAPKSHRKAKRKSPVLEVLLQTNHVVIQKPPVQTFYYRSSLLHPSKAHRICSVKMAGYSWQDFLEIVYSYFNTFFFFVYLLCLALTWSRAGTLWQDGGRGRKHLKHFVQRKRTLAMESCLWARCLDLVHVSSTIYMFSTFVKNTRCVLCWGQIRGVQEVGKIPVDTCLDGLGNLDAAFIMWLSQYIRLWAPRPASILGWKGGMGSGCTGIHRS